MTQKSVAHTPSRRIHATPVRRRESPVTAVADTSGDIVERYLFDPYGHRTILDPNFSADADNTSDFALMHGHQGGKYDSVLTNQMLFRNRVYDVETMRWLQQDPLGYVDGLNCYNSHRSNVNKYQDPDGRESIFVMGDGKKPPLQFDNDFPYDPNATPTLSDYFNWRWYAGKGFGASAVGVLPHAVRSYLHYRENTGTDLFVSYEDAYQQDSKIRNRIDEISRVARADTATLYLQTGKCFFRIYSPGWLSVDYPATENWQKTIGGHSVWAYWWVRVDPSRNTIHLGL
jgi:RHS repeat-associated protein